MTIRHTIFRDYRGMLLLLAVFLARFPTPDVAGAPVVQIAPQPVEEIKRPDPGETVLSSFSTKKLGQIRVDSTPPTGETPVDRSALVFEREEPISLRNREWMPAEYYWLAAELVHQPLYFDDIPLERYGQTIRPALQPLLSGRRFFGTILRMPAWLLIDRPFSWAYSYGYYRPGSPTPCTRQHFGR